MKVIFLSYANSSKLPLDNLAREDDEVEQSLVESNKGLFIIHREPSATLERINKALGRFTGNIAIFHFSGHAGKDALLFNEELANAGGLAYQLGESAKRGTLKLVVLNGCSTAGQVRRLLEIGVPAVIATNAAVEDKSATEFSVRFYQNISKRKMTIREAFANALGPAQTAVTHRDLKIVDKPVRSINFLKDQDDLAPLWELFCRHEDDVNINPLPVLAVEAAASFQPNEQLTHLIFEALAAAGIKSVQEMKKAEVEREVTPNEKQKEIIKYLPYPVSAHLQKLFSPVEGSKGFDKIGLCRLEQIGRAYHIGMEFLGFIMLAQLWESKLREDIGTLPYWLKKLIYDYFYLARQQRAVFDYLPFIRSIREFLNTQVKEYFVEELQTIKDLTAEGQDFTDACDHLHFIRTQTYYNRMDEQKARELCPEAEVVLGRVFAHLGFLHRYTLTSIQKIHILKYRHNLQAHFNHEIIRLMDAFGTPVSTHYVLPTFLDNRGVVLTKQNLTYNPKKKEYEADQLAFLNLSPFVIDRNAFESRTDRSNLMFFEQFMQSSNIYRYKNVRKPEDEDDDIEVVNAELYEALPPQFEAFRSMIMVDNTETDKI